MTWRTSNSKFGNRRTEYNGLSYDSKKEASRAAELDLLVRSGVVERWERQVPFQVEINNIKIFKYLADFVVYYKDGTRVVEDVKSDVTKRLPVYRIKKKAVEAYYGIKIHEC